MKHRPGTFLLIAALLREQIRQGHVQGALPSEAVFMARYGVSRTTIRRALAALRKEGHVVSAPGVGWYVAGGAATDGMPTYRRMARELEAAIRAGDYAPGSMIPGENALMKRYDVSRPTARRAIDVLRRQGLVDPQAGRGTFVI